MKNQGQNQESSKKKQAGEYLKNADKLLKQSEFDSALEEVERCLEIDPGNFYANAYKERIISLREKSKQQPAPPQKTAPVPVPAAQAAVPVPAAPAVAPVPAAQAAVPVPAAPAVAPVPAAQAEVPSQVAPPVQTEMPIERAPVREPSEHHTPLTQEEARKKFLDDKRKAEEEIRKQSEDARRRAEEELRRRAQELEAMHNTESLERRKSQEEAKRNREGEQRRRSGEEDRAAHETEARRKAEDDVRKKLEEDIRVKNFEQQSGKEAADALRIAEADAKARAKEQKLHDYLLEAKEHLTARNFPEAVIPLLKITTIEKGHAEAQQMLAGIREIQEQAWGPQLKEAGTVSREKALDLYGRALAIAWQEGTPDASIAETLQNLRSRLNITDTELASLEPHAKLEAYASAVKELSAAGTPVSADNAFLARLQKELGITDAQRAAAKQKPQ